VNENEFIERLDRFGADLAAWPHADAEGAEMLLVHSDAARKRHAEAIAVARLVTAALPSNGFDVARVRSSVLRRIAEPASRLDSLIDWLMPGGWTGAWRPAAVALVPLVLGLSLGLAVPDVDAPDAAMEGSDL
jgi:hypothetical protein